LRQGQEKGKEGKERKEARTGLTKEWSGRNVEQKGMLSGKEC
jgi:hypothetical protein